MSMTPSERTRQRRRLLKAATGVPVIFVLPTGAALANSSVDACVQRGLDQNPNPGFIPVAGNPYPGVSGGPPDNYWAWQETAPGSGMWTVKAYGTQPVAGESCWSSLKASGLVSGPKTTLIA